jgi:hypothetical protein
MTSPIELKYQTEVANALNLYLQEVRPNLFRMENVCEYVAKNMRYIDFAHDSPETLVIDPNFIRGLVEELLRPEVVSSSMRVILFGDGLVLKDVKPSEVTRQDPSLIEDYFVSRKNILLYSTTDWLQWYLNGACRQLIDSLERSNELNKYQRMQEKKIEPQQPASAKPSKPAPLVVADVDLIYQIGYAYDSRIPGLEDLGYIKCNSYSIIDSKPHTFYFKPSQNENPEHNCLKLQIHQHLKGKGAKDLATLATDRADIEFTDKDGRKIGVEVLTDTYLDQPDKLKAKIKDYGSRYDYWVVVGTNALTCRKLKKIMDGTLVLERKDIISHLNPLV